MRQAFHVALVSVGIAVAALPLWLALRTPSEKAESPSVILTDLPRWDGATTDARRAAAEDVARRLPDFALLRLESFSCGGQTHEVAIYSHAKTGLEFVLVPGGTFLMGSPESEPGRSSTETQHHVTLTRPFLIASTLCTQASYEKVIGMNPATTNRGSTFPVETVSWDDAKSFCGKAGVELPSESQWEYACRAGTTTAYCFGDAEGALGDYAWYGANSGGQTHPVAQKRANAFGLYDVHGNVLEWCRDGFAEYPSGAVTDPLRDWGVRRVVRGGNWLWPARWAHSAYRDGLQPGDRYTILGFRPAKTVPTE